jgi:ParB family chromosome partitioning protein
MNLAAITREFREIPLGLIDAPELASRTTMDESLLDELTASIRSLGLVNPITVARVDGRYEVLAGHRRTIACKRAGLVAAPCIVYPTKDAALEAIKYAENRHREELNPADEAIWFHELLERDCGGDVDVLCEQLGEKRSYVEGRLLLFQGDPVVFEALQAGEIKIGVAHKLNECTDQRMRRYFLNAALRGGATIAVVTGWIMDWKRDSGLQPPAGGNIVEAAAPAPVPETNYFRCACCGGDEHVHTMVPVNMHQHCKLAVFDKLIASYRGE